MKHKPVIAITMGDPFGCGPEITVKALSDPAVCKKARLLVVGDASCLRYAADVQKRLGRKEVRIHPVSSVSEALFEYGTIDVLDLGLVRPEDIPGDAARPAPFGAGPTGLGGEAGYQYVIKAIHLAMDGEADATVTNAFSKEAVNMAGHHYSGHTEIFAEETGTKSYAMMLAEGNLRVVHVSTHVSLREACDRVKTARVLEVIRLADAACVSLGISRPRIAVAGLNPHCGEGGLFGREEIEQIQPAIDRALAEGICIPDKKPLPPDTVFSKAAGGLYDIVVAMYHDQGHIPLKVKGFVYNRKEKNWKAVKGVNITLGLPVIRTSVDHGTAYEVAGSGEANEASLKNAVFAAVKMAAKKGNE